MAFRLLELVRRGQRTCCGEGEKMEIKGDFKSKLNFCDSKVINIAFLSRNDKFICCG
jgi:hypothetical protein